MRYLLLIMLLLPVASQAQKDPCRKISKKVERRKGVTTYKSPETKYAWVLKQVKKDTAFGLLIHFYDTREHFDKHGASIQFEDGTTISDDYVTVKCEQEKTVVAGSAALASSSSNGGRYVLQAFFRITEETAGKFTSSRIASVRLHDAFQDIPKNDGYQLKKYVGCVMNKW